MSIRLQPGEPAPEGIRRIVVEQLDGGIHELSDRRRNPHKAIHSARQRCKRVRAVLRLARSDLGNHYRTENQRFRDIARGLSDVRDAEAVIEAVDKLYPFCESQRETDLLRAARRSLVARRREVVAGETGLAEKMREAAEAFREARERVATWPLTTPGFDLLERGLRETYGHSRAAFAVAYDEPSDVRFHEVRKRVKHHWYQMRIVHNVWPEMLGGYRGQVKTLSDLLGDDHDLSVMGAILREPASASGLEDLTSLIGRRRSRLQAEAHALGRRIFAERPRHFTRRLGEYWQAWEEATSSAPATEQESVQVDERAVA